MFKRVPGVPIRRCRVVLLFCLALAPLISAAYELPFASYTPDHDPGMLTSASVQVIYQDRIGYIWLGFYSSGLARYDGDSIVSYSIADGLPDPTVRELAQDAAGHLWVGCDTGLVVSQEPLQDYGPGERVIFVKRVGANPVHQTRVRRECLVNTADDWIWVGTTGDGIYRYRFGPGGTLEEHQLATPGATNGSSQTVNAIVARAAGEVWAAISDGSVLVFTLHDGTVPGLSRRIEGDAELAESPITSFLEQEDGTLWAGAADGTIRRMRPGNDRLEIVNQNLTARIVSVIETRDGMIWAASLGSGLLRIDPTNPSSAQHFTRKTGLIGDTLWDLRVDDEGNLWIGQNGGLSRLRPDYRAFDALTEMTLPEPGVFASIPPDGRDPWLWVGTGAGLTVVDHDGRVRTIRIDEGLTDNSVYAATRDKEGRIWIGTVGGVNAISIDGLSSPVPAGEIAPRRISIFGRGATITGWRFDVVYACKAIELLADETTEARRESILCAGNDGILVIAGNDRYELRGVAGLPGTGATNLAIDDHDILWVGTSDSGVFRSTTPISLDMLARAAGPQQTEIRSTVFEPAWNEESGAPNNGIRNLAWAEGRMWIGTSAGLAVTTTNPFHVEMILDKAHGLGGNVVVGTAYAEDEHALWVSQNEGLAKIDARTRKVLALLSKSDGLLENEAWAYGPLSIDREGTVYFGTPKGLSIYRPSFDVPNRNPPRLRLERADFRQGARGANEITIEYAALSFVNEQAVRFQTRLVGYDSDWSTETAESKIRYTNLPAWLFDRAYTFEVRAQNNDGVWSPEPLRYRFAVAPPYWLQWWAALGYVVVFLASIFAFTRVRIRTLARKNRELELIVDQRTREIRSQAMEIETIDNIVQAINREVELERVLQALLEHGMILFPRAEKGAAFIFGPDQRRSVVAAAVGYALEELSELRYSPGDILLQYASDNERMQEGVYLVRDLASRAGSERVGRLPLPTSLLAMDVTLADQTEALLLFENFTDADAFKTSDLRKLRRCREHAVTAVAKAKLLRELALKNREAEQASEAKSRFLANMSHELRTPLNSIIGFSELIVERLENEIPPRYLHFLRLILSSGQHLLNIINDILDLSKVEAGKMEVYSEQFSVPPVLENVAQIMRATSAKDEVTIEIDAAPDLPRIDTDPGKFKQILYNLLSNAVKFSQPRSTVRVTARFSAVEPADGFFEIAIADEGIGIAETDLAVIFDEFRQLDSTSARRFGGTGLGLSLVQRYVQLLGGTVSATSELGTGSTFTVRLPARFARAQRPRKRSSAERVLTSREIKILVVEDDSHAYDLLRRDLEAAGYLPIRARRGEEALRLARLIHPAAITLDILLPGIDGWEVLKKLKETEETREIPVVIVSITQSEELGLALGASDYFVKPVDGPLLSHRIDELIAHHGGGPPARIVLIDDDPMVTEMISEALRGEGYSVEIEHSGGEGLERVRTTRPDLVILDLLMPGLSGFEVADELAHDDSTRSIPIIILTAKELTHDDRERLESKIRGIVHKGDRTRTDLIDAIRRIASDPETPETEA